jgi:hypothetical protein
VKTNKQTSNSKKFLRTFFCHLKRLILNYLNYFKSHLFTLLSGKVLVSTGDTYPTSVKSEVIDLEDSNNICQDLEDYPIQVEGAV